MRAILRLVMGAAAVLGTAGGIGLLRGAAWSRPLIAPVSIIYLLDLPFGTALGAYGLWVVLHPGTREALVARRR